jgi:hypothetical protein
MHDYLRMNSSVVFQRKIGLQLVQRRKPSVVVISVLLPRRTVRGGRAPIYWTHRGINWRTRHIIKVRLVVFRTPGWGHLLHAAYHQSHDRLGYRPDCATRCPAGADGKKVPLLVASPPHARSIQGEEEAHMLTAYHARPIPPQGDGRMMTHLHEVAAGLQEGEPGVSR